ncbi:DcrB-related protein [Chondromyces apiculatus]|uniref:DUF1795 domain-containing protein n=1 Tax=Chondromyces apiculatus DSM 436 TaxID=1192034 RepID=A0A017T890_9BACT|nr:DcrB-related protein [Chondromyces apiculatus]EYF05454.1 Hypothetical protein CAP_3181 [Chondromyces apiculatus DSM 436]
MPRYEHPDVSFEVPRDWEDRSVAAFSAPLAPGKKTGPNVVLTRDKLSPGENLAGYADRSMVELAQRLEKFTLQKRSDVTVSGLPAVELRFTWKGSSGLVDQRLVMCATGKRLVLSITATVPRTAGVDMESTMNRILATVQIPGVRGGEGVS